MQEFFWPTVQMYDKEWDTVYSFERNDITVVKSCNMAGKDFLSGFIAPTTMIKYEECRGITTSVVDDHLRVLWDEIRWWVEESSYPWDRETKGVLLAQNGGPLVYNHRDIRMRTDLGYSNKSYLRGMVSETGEKMSGHHARDMTFLLVDEASGMHDMVWTFAERWCKKYLLIGNPNDCQNVYRRFCDQGDVPDPARPGYYHRKVIRIRAEDTPNVKLALEQIKRGQQPTNDVVVPGVMMYENGAKGYRYRREHWDEHQQCVSLDGDFYVGKDIMLFPKAWLDAAKLHQTVRKAWRRGDPTWMGIDTAEGGDDTCWVVMDDHGILTVVSLKTADTNFVYGKTLELMREWGVVSENVCFDQGGGGVWVADRMRAADYKGVKTVGFGVIKLDPQRAMKQFGQKREVHEEKGQSQSRRSEMYFDLSTLLEIPAEHDDPVIVETARRFTPDIVKSLPLRRARFALPLPACEELIRQLEKIPKRYDDLGRFKLLPKSDPKDPQNQDTLRYILGRSPDQADAFAIANYVRTHKGGRTSAGVG